MKVFPSCNVLQPVTSSQPRRLRRRVMAVINSSDGNESYPQIEGKMTELELSVLRIRHR